MRIRSALPLYLLIYVLSGCKAEVKIVDNCGDGVLDPGEACDGEATSAINCEALGFYQQSDPLVCRADCTLDLSVCSSRCGDDIIQVGFGEQCEGDDLSAESCTSLGLGVGNLGCNEFCRYDTTGCEYSITCGDDLIIHRFEDCEGDDLDGETCETLGWYGGTLACGEFDCLYDLESCQNFGKCGDNTVQGTYGEECDGSELDSSTCESLGYYGGTLTCDNFCHFNLGDCASFGKCGDSIIQAGDGEICEIGDVGGQTCESRGWYGGDLGCNDTCTALDESGCAAVGRCGDNLVQVLFEEECDGSDLAGATCRDFGFFSGTPSCSTACVISSSTCQRAVRVTTGQFFACALLADGSARCWGGNSVGELGNGTTVSSLVPVAVQGLTDATDLVAGSEFACALISDGTVKCWGHNGYGQLGDGTTVDHATPQTVQNLSGVTALTAGSFHACALLQDGTVRCWGRNGSSQLGDGSSTNRLLPVSPTGLSGVRVIAGGYYHTCAVLLTGQAQCWGVNLNGRLGDGTTTTRNTPTNVTGITTAIHIALGNQHTCALLEDGTVRCWGYNTYGQLGDGSTTESWTPLTVSGLGGAVSLALGFTHSCALLSDGTLRCWGHNRQGELGDGTDINRSLPVTTTGLTDVEVVAADEIYTCAVNGDGLVWCWGFNDYGQLGDGTTITRLFPAEVLP